MLEQGDHLTYQGDILTDPMSTISRGEVFNVLVISTIRAFFNLACKVMTTLDLQGKIR